MRFLGVDAGVVVVVVVEPGGEGSRWYTIPHFSASSSASVSEEVERREWRSGWRLLDLKAASSKKRWGL